MARVLPIVFSIGTSIAFVNCSARPLEAKNQTLMVAVWRIPMIIGPSFSQLTTSVLALKVTQEGPTVRGTPNRYSDWCTE